MEEKFAFPTSLPNSRASSGVPCRHISPRTGIWERISVAFCPYCHTFYQSNVHIKAFLETSSRFSRAMHPGTNRGRTAKFYCWWLVFRRSRSFFFWDVLSSVCCVLMSNVVIHLKDGAKTAPLHTALPANPRHWLGADSKAAHVGLCTTQSQVISSNILQEKKKTIHKPRAPLIQFMHTRSCSFLLQRLLLSFWRPITL